MKLKQSVVTTLLGLSLLFFVAGCGDTFRPIANPLPKPSPDPSGSHTAVVVFSGGAIPAGGTAAPGTSMQINISGDSITGQLPVGVNPIYALVDSSLVTSVNQGDSSLSIYSSGLGNFVAGATSPPLVTTVTLPDAAPTFAVRAAGNTYVALSGTGQVGVVNGSSQFVGALTVGTNPTALVALPNGSKVYAINQGDNTVSVVHTGDNSVGGPIAVGTTPVYGVASADSTRVFIVNKGSGTVSIIDTGTDTVIPPPAGSTLSPHETVQVGTAPSFAIYDSQLNHVYVTNETSNTLSIIDANSAAPTVNTRIAEIALQGTTPKGVAVLPSTTKIYVANFGSNSVSVIDALSNLVLKTIPVGIHPISIVASADSAKVIVANQGDQASATAGSVSMIKTATDVETARINAPASICPTSAACAPQTAVVVGVF